MEDANAFRRVLAFATAMSVPGMGGTLSHVLFRNSGLRLKTLHIKPGVKSALMGEGAAWGSALGRLWKSDHKTSQPSPGSQVTHRRRKAH